MHNHVIAGDFGYLPTYSDEEGYTYGSEALKGLKEYVNTVVDSIESVDMPYKYVSTEKNRYDTGFGILLQMNTNPPRSLWWCWIYTPPKPLMLQKNSMMNATKVMSCPEV